ncbi:MAG: RNA 2'-phosphotransferase [Deltaproteobacteria bacterium]|nr:RNA 2'-phosphotransferase [Deltaproteobacteria bacterium]
MLLSTTMQRNGDPKKLAKLLAYALGRTPDEFGLVPDGDGFVKIKEFLKAVNEEEGWGFVRRAAIDEILCAVTSPPIEVLEDRIRAVDREHLPERRYEPDPPALLYTCVRRRAYPHTLKKGIGPMGRGHVVLASTEDLALKLGHRFDPKPVLLTVNTSIAHDLGCLFMRASERLLLSRYIPEGGFRGPALPKEKKAAQGREATGTPDKTSERSRTPGSYFPDLSEPPLPRHRTKKERRRDEVAWKSERRRKSRRKTI